jgi:hypothetical protein
VERRNVSPRGIRGGSSKGRRRVRRSRARGKQRDEEEKEVFAHARELVRAVIHVHLDLSRWGIIRVTNLVIPSAARDLLSPPAGRADPSLRSG